MTYYLKYLLIMEFRFDSILCSELGKENSDAGHIKCSRGPQVPHPCPNSNFASKKLKKGKSFICKIC